MSQYKVAAGIFVTFVGLTLTFQNFSKVETQDLSKEVAVESELLEEPLSPLAELSPIQELLKTKSIDPNWAALYSCSKDGQLFFTRDANCEGELGQGWVGFVHTTPDPQMRPMYRSGTVASSGEAPIGYIQ